ncbi:MAG TPA: hypothetical protein VI341_11210 [Actinomycetota bacterium]
MNRTTVRLACIVALVALVALAAPATAGGRDVIREGPCSGAADWKLKLSPENGRIEVEYEVDSNVNGQSWRVRLFKNGDRIFRGTRQTHGPSGSFELRVVTSDPTGADVFRARAVNPASGQTCAGSATF